MPELPEVEAAMNVLRRHAKGRVIARTRLLHPSMRRRISPARLRSLAGAQIERVERRGKHQLLHPTDGRVLHAHFRMNGDWEYGKATLGPDASDKAWTAEQLGRALGARPITLALFVKTPWRDWERSNR